jgi:Family of unknown function (DUF6498)
VTLRRAAHASPVAIAVLLAANAVPLVGVIALGWDLATLVAVYWAENGVVGIYAIGRILTAGGPAPRREQPAVPQPPPPPAATGGGPFRAGTGLPVALLVPFFCVHYGLFWFVHGIFVWTVLPLVFSGMTGNAFGMPATVAYPDPRVVVNASVFLLLSHGVSFVANWLVGGEHLTSTPQAEMNAPYSRVMILHLTILLGAFAAVMLGQSIGTLVVMVALKTAVDLGAHLAERRRAAERATSATARSVPDGLDAPAA